MPKMSDGLFSLCVLRALVLAQETVGSSGDMRQVSILVLLLITARDIRLIERSNSYGALFSPFVVNFWKTAGCCIVFVASVPMNFNKFAFNNAFTQQRSFFTLTRRIFIFNFKFSISDQGAVVILGRRFFCYMPLEPDRLRDVFFGFEFFKPAIIDFF